MRFSVQKTNWNAFYNNDVNVRQEYLNRAIQSSEILKKNIDEKVLKHWVDESGYSFPSGHSFNAFLLATILSYAIYYTSNHKNYRKYYFIPFVWALSVAIARVTIGAHTSLDVSFGATLGTIIGLLFLFFDTTKKLVIHKKVNQ